MEWIFGIAPTGPVSGTSHVYTWTNATLSASIYTRQAIKFLPLMARIGTWAIRNISGPGSTIDDSKPYTVCYAYAVNQCRSGSGVGDVFIAAPLVDQLAGQAQCCGNNYTSIRDINILPHRRSPSGLLRPSCATITPAGPEGRLRQGFSTPAANEQFLELERHE
jgi:hypothetical protein